MQRKETPSGSGSTADRKLAQNKKDSYYLFRQSPSDQDARRQSMLEGNVKNNEDERIRMPNFS